MRLLEEDERNKKKLHKKEQKRAKIEENQLATYHDGSHRTMMGRGKKETITVVIVPWKAAS
jgi:hypothetical protein